MKSAFLKKIIAIVIATSSITAIVPMQAFAMGPSNYYNWQNSNEDNGYWVKYGSGWYYYTSSGKIKTGWIFDNGNWYYSDFNGVMQTGVVQIEGNIYIFAEDGAMQTGRTVFNGFFYDIDASGVITGSNVPTPTKAFDVNGAATVPYRPDQLITTEHSSPTNPSTNAADDEAEYTIKYKDDDGDTLKTKTVTKNSRIKLYEPEKKDYKFVEWNTKKNSNGDSYDSGDILTIKDDLTLYAQWDEDDDEKNKILVESIDVSGKNDANSITTDKGTLQMSASILPVNADNKKVTWSVENRTGQATINKNGLLTAVSDGKVVVVATAKDSSEVIGRTTITISGQTSSGNNNSENGNNNSNNNGNSSNNNNNGSNNNSNNGSNSSNNNSSNGSSSNGGTVTVVDSNIKLDNVILDKDESIIDYPLLKESGKLPSKVTVSVALSSGKTEKVEADITGWSGNFDGSVENNNGYTLKANYKLPSKYKLADNVKLPDANIKVIVKKAQSDNRKVITGIANIADVVLNSDQNLVNSSLLNKAGILPDKVTLNYDGGSVEAGISQWTCSGFNGKTGTYTLTGKISMPAGYLNANNLEAKLNLKVQANQTAKIVGLEVVKNADLASAGRKELKLTYIEGEKLDLSNLVVNATYNDGSKKQIKYSQFTDAGITTPDYIDKMTLTMSNSSSKGIPVKYGDVIGHTEKITVTRSSEPSLTFTSTTSAAAIFDTKSPTDLSFSYTLGNGKKKAKKIKDVYLGTKVITSNDYIDSKGKLTLPAHKLSELANGITKPSITTLKVVFELENGTTMNKGLSVSFITTPDKPDVKIKSKSDLAKDNTITFTNLTPNVSYEYCVTASSVPNWNNSATFRSNGDSLSVTNTSFADKRNVFVRVKQINGNGVINPASDYITLPIVSDNIGKTLNDKKTISSFKIVDGASNETYIGKIKEGNSSTNGTIEVVVPHGFDKSKAKAVFEVNNGAGSGYTVDKNSGDALGDSYTVTAEDKSAKTYDIKLTSVQLQEVTVRNDNCYSVSTTDADGNTTTQKVPYIKAYSDAGLSIDTSKSGEVLIKGATLNNDALEQVRSNTPYMLKPELVYVGLKDIDTINSSKKKVSVKVADSLEELNSSSAKIIRLTGTSANVLNGTYVEQIPAVKIPGNWEMITTSTPITKYYAWTYSDGSVIYTQLKVTVQ